MIRNKSSLTSNKGHLRIEFFPDKRLIIFNRWFWVTLRLCSPDLLSWYDFPGYFRYLGNPSATSKEKDHEVMVIIPLLDISVKWTRRSWRGWELTKYRDRSYMTLYDQNGEEKKSKLISI